MGGERREAKKRSDETQLDGGSPEIIATPLPSVLDLHSLVPKGRMPCQSAH
jgi:hypothetical protein